MCDSGVVVVPDSRRPSDGHDAMIKVDVDVAEQPCPVTVLLADVLCSEEW